ncbi:CPBP family intramembrane glutamic endopeptidase [Corynebacterium sp. UBA2622]|uniref:CPBP family intramembrane glutamic endopeptidase n=1 Tax=Corynebacterium sp. UBA2622 TaxID=1946393 RepID=UPI0039C8A4D9
MARTLSFLLPCAAGAAGLYAARRMGDGTPGYYAATCVTAAVYLGAWLGWGRRGSFSRPGAARDLAAGIGLGLGLAVVFVGGALVVSHVPLLAEPVADLLSATDRGGLPATLFVLVINGIAEELVYRDVVPGQLTSRGLVRGRMRVGAVSVVIYTLVTVAMGVPLLLVGAATLGALCQWLAARTGRLWAPVAAHLTWSTSMLFLMPVFFS